MVLAMPALADLPEALDRLPGDAAVILGVQNIKEVHQDLTDLAQFLGIPEMQQGLAMASMALNAPGLDSEGSIAIGLLADDNGRLDNLQSPNLVAILPMTDFPAFLGMLGGEAGDEIGSVIAINFQGQDLFLRDLGRGYAALSPTVGTLDTLDGGGGNLDMIESRLGDVGSRVATRSDVFVAVDFQVVSPYLKEGLVEIQDSMAMAAQMAGDQAQSIEQVSAMAEELVRTVTEDGQMGILGIELSDAGIGLDLAAQFRAGTETADLLHARGHAQDLLDHVPNDPYLFAVAVDTSDEGTKTIMKSLSETGMKMNPNAGMWGFMDAKKLIDHQEGMAFMLGNPPALMMGGLLSQSVQYTRCTSPSKSLATSRQVIEEMNGLSAQGMHATTSYQPNALEVDGTPVDSWSIKFEVDPEHPQAQMMSMMMMMIFGPQGGPSGYSASSDSGCVTTYSHNSAFLSKALATANRGGGLGSDELVQLAGAHLPDDSIFVAYIGFDSVLEQASSLMAMMGGGFELDIPEHMQPVALGVAANGGGLRGRLFVPRKVMEVAMQLAAAGEAIEPNDSNGGDSPRF